jgi:type II secretory pathway pseudopilin PulG
MKIFLESKIENQVSNADARNFRVFCSRPSTLGARPIFAFTMIEIAICLAIIGIALVAIIGVLPLGMNTQRDNREETIINQDATVLLEAVRNGTRGMDDLTNYVVAITNYWTLYNADGTVTGNGANGYTYNNVSITSPSYPIAPYSFSPITNGANIIGLLSTPEFIFTNNPDYTVIPTLFNTAGYSNHVYVTVRSISGLATEKPPQNNDIMLGDTFTYRILCVNAAEPVDTNTFSYSSADQNYNRQLSANEHEIRMTFFWPLQPNGKLGIGRQTFRATVAGQLSLTNVNNQPMYLYNPKSFLVSNFTNAP